MKTMLMLLTAALPTLVAGDALIAQVRIQTAPGAFTVVTGDPDRPMIGVSTRSSGKRDTLGLLVESVTRDGPAEKAGIEEGDRLVSANGVNLRLSPADAGEPDMDGIANRRLIRELEKHDAGDEVELGVYRDGATRSVRLKTVAAKELTRSAFTESASAFRLLRKEAPDRALLGISLGGTGSRRDTLGVLVVGISDDGPAAKGGIEEGDRIAAINGVDLRVAREDAGDWQASRARVNRLNREMEKVKAGDAVELRVYANGQTRTVRVEAAKASDVRSDGAAFLFDDFTGALHRLRGLESAPGVIMRVRPPTSAEPMVEVPPKVLFERQLRSAEEAIRPKAEIEKRLRSVREAIKVSISRRASAV